MSPTTRLPLAARFTGRLWPSILLSYQGPITILSATETELEMDKQLSKSESAEPFIVSDDAMKTARR